MVDYMKAHLEKPILVLRTFSKYYAMAGLRVGYALGSEADWNHAEMFRFLEPECLCPESGSGRPGRPGILSQKAKIVEEENIWKEMAALGCNPSQSNFIYFDTGKDPPDSEQLWKKGIRIGAFSEPCERGNDGRMSAVSSVPERDSGNFKE